MIDNLCYNGIPGVRPGHTPRNTEVRNFIKELFKNFRGDNVPSEIRIVTLVVIKLIN